MDRLINAWQFEYALLPCIVAYLVFDIPIVYRRITRKLYVPIYFAFFPFGYSDELYARYFDEDHYYIVGGPFPEEQRRNARIKIIWISVISLVLTMALSPFATALFSHYFLTDEQFTQFFWTLAVVKATLLLWSLYDLKWNFRVTSVVPIVHIAVVYVLYWSALLIFLNRAKDWIGEKAAIGGFPEVITGIVDYLVFDVGIGILFVSVLGFLIPWRLTQDNNESTNE